MCMYLQSHHGVCRCRQDVVVPLSLHPCVHYICHCFFSVTLHMALFLFSYKGTEQAVLETLFIQQSVPEVIWNSEQLLPVFTAQWYPVYTMALFPFSYKGTEQTVLKPLFIQQSVPEVIWNSEPDNHILVSATSCHVHVSAITLWCMQVQAGCSCPFEFASSDL